MRAIAVACSICYHGGMPTDLDRWQNLMRILGWSTGETRWIASNRAMFWQVDAMRDDQTIIARASGQTEAWCEALRLAGVVQRDED